MAQDAPHFRVRFDKGTSIGLRDCRMNDVIVGLGVCFAAWAMHGLVDADRFASVSRQGRSVAMRCYHSTDHGPFGVMIRVRHCILLARHGLR